MSHAILHELSGGSGGYVVYEFLDGANLAGWVVVANTAKSYLNGPSFDAGKDYYYFDTDLTSLASFEVKLAESGAWPRTWRYANSATWEWNNPHQTYASASSGPTSGMTYFDYRSGPDSSLYFWGWTWPSPTVDGKIEYWSNTGALSLSGVVGDNWEYARATPGTLTGYNIHDDIPAQ